VQYKKRKSSYSFLSYSEEGRGRSALNDARRRDFKIGAQREKTLRLGKEAEPKKRKKGSESRPWKGVAGVTKERKTSREEKKKTRSF